MAHQIQAACSPGLTASLPPIQNTSTNTAMAAMRVSIR